MINAFYNGRFANEDDISIPLTDRSVYFGDGIYDACIGYGENLFLYERHIERFFNNAKRLAVKCHYSSNEIKEIIATVSEGIEGTFFAYVQLSRKGGARSHTFDENSYGNLLITAKPITLPAPTVQLRLVTTADVRYEMCDVKTLNLLPSVLAAQFAERSGADEAILVRGKYVTECSHSNVHIVKDGRLITHPADNHILPGIERWHLIETAKKSGIETEERPFDKAELYSADGVIVSSTSKLALAASEVDGVRYSYNSNCESMLLISKMHEDFYSSIL